MIVNKVYFVGECTNDPHAPVKVYPCNDEGCLKLDADLRAKLGEKKTPKKLEELILEDEIERVNSRIQKSGLKIHFIRLATELIAD